MLLVAWLALAPTPLAAQEAAANGADPLAAQETSLSEARAAVEVEIAQLEQELGTAREAGDETATAYLERLLSLHQSTRRALGLHLAAVARSRELATQTAEIEARLDTGVGATVAEPDLLALDALRDQLEAVREESRAYGDAVASAQRALDEARSVRTQKGELRQEAQAELDGNEDPAAALQLRRNLRLREVDSRLAVVSANLRETELANEQAEQQLRALRERFLDESVQDVVARLQVTEEDKREQQLRLQRREQDLNRQLEVAKGRAGTAYDRYIAASSTALPAEPTTDEERLQVERREALRRAWEAAEAREELLNGQAARLRKDWELWDFRFDMFLDELGRPLLWERRGQLADGIAELENDRDLIRQRLEDYRRTLEALDVRLGEGYADVPGYPALREQRVHVLAAIEAYEGTLADIESSLRFRRRFESELEARTGEFSLGAWLSELGERLSVAWRYRILDVDPTEVEVWLTPRKIVSAVIIFIVGVMIARFSRRFLGRRVFPRFKLEEGASAAYQKLAFYFLLFFFLLVALRTMEVPLTAFTVLGGALAIGVGFGSQNLLNNFISGLIMLAERPVRVGDLIEVENTYGIVDQIGARSTRVTTSDNISIVIPNSAFLETNVINWTLSNDVIRTQVSVGVAYGSPTRDVDRLLSRAVKEHGRVLKAPEPIVIFADFGDNALIFDVYFWIRSRTVMARRRVESDIRFRIDNLFREAGITIAFPQRDVHVDNLSPLDVRVRPPDWEPQEEKGGPEDGAPLFERGAG